jgi:tellurite resistance protein
MAKLIEWIRKASDVVLDPQKDSRIQEYARFVAGQIKEQRSSFDFWNTVEALQIQQKDVPLVQDKVYEFALGKVWQDRLVDDKEKAGLEQIARHLHLEPTRAKELNLQFGQQVFQRALAEALSDGYLSEKETAHLGQIAASAGVTVRELVVRYFSDWGEGFLRGLFATCVEKGSFTDHDWANLLHAAQSLQLTEDELLKAIQSQAERFITHVLTDAKADGRLSSDEKHTLTKLLDRLQIGGKVRTYVTTEMAELELYTNIADGRLPLLRVADIGLRAGEIAHFQGPACYGFTRVLSSGPKTESYQGIVTITDYRLLFNSPTRSFEIKHRKVAGLAFTRQGVQVQSLGKGSGTYTFGQAAKLACAVYNAAVRKANQTMVEKMDGLPTRHIPRDVRQRVWQVYGGRCAECGASQYLEFDHIVPVAKGGGNDEKNVQLLCRGCNGKKSDNV